MDNLRLITIPVSHFCEKARWALDRLALPYSEERHIQLFHYVRSYMTSGGPNVPVLLDGKQVVADSTAILKHIDQYADTDARLYPTNQSDRREVEQLEDLFDEELGVDARRWLYYQMTGQPFKTLYTMSQGVPAYQKLLLPLAFPFIYMLIRSHPDTLKRDVDEGMLRTRRIIKTIDLRLSDGRPYLVGPRFTAADLALACMMSPLVVPPQYGIRLPTLDKLPGPMRHTVLEFRDTLSGRHVMKMFETERWLKPQKIPEINNVETI